MTDPANLPDEELVAEDDAVIGRVFRLSLVALVVLGALGAGIFWLATREPQQAAPAEAGVESPRAVEGGPEVPDVPFREITAEAGIDFVHENGARGDKLLPETMGGGVVAFDYQGDGDADLLFVNGAPWPDSAGSDDLGAPSPLYSNDGSGRFEDVGQAAGLRESFFGMGASVADVDCDGHPDLYFTAVGPNRFYGSVSADAFEERDVGARGEGTAWSTCSAFFDADRDGDLDLFVGNYVRWSREIDFEVDYRLTGMGRAYGPPLNYQGSYSSFFRNEGRGRFVDSSAAAGFHVTNPATGEPVGKALGVLPIDVDADGDVDLFVANDTVQNFLFQNLGDGTFRERGVELGVAFDRNGMSTGAMGIDAAWYRNDAALGFAIGNFSNEMTSLYVQQGGSGIFADEAIGEGIGAPTRLRLGFGIFFFDYDLDGRLDLFAANGHLEDEINKVQASQHYEQPPQLFWNAGPGSGRTFVEVPAGSQGDLATPVVGRGTTCADFDGDGDLDVVMTQVGRTARLYRNDQATGHHWVRIRLRGDGACNVDAIGAIVELEQGGKTQRRTVVPTRGYLSQTELPLTFGLGDADRIDALRVTWPDGTRSELRDLEPDRLHVVSKGG